MARQRERSMQLLSDREQEREEDADAAAGVLRCTSGTGQPAGGSMTNVNSPAQAAQLLATLSKVSMVFFYFHFHFFPYL